MSNIETLKSDNHKKILLVITGGIAAYKSPDLVRSFQKRGMDVTCVLTQGAKEMVNPLALASMSKNKVYDKLFNIETEGEIDHISLVRQADLVVVAPATANIIAKMAIGIADDLASTLLLAHNGRMLIAPAMNSAMWENPATQNNYENLLSRENIDMIGPSYGELACGEVGIGRMTDIEEIVNSAKNILLNHDFDQFKIGRKIVITAGPTREAIDPVRFISNYSSGKQGYAIAEASVREGYEVILITGPTNIPYPRGAEIIKVESSKEMFEAVSSCLPCDVLIMVAAVADYKLKDVADEKLKKSSGDGMIIELVKNLDILKTISQMKDGRPELVIGFAAETENLYDNAMVKLKNKGCDWILANNVSAKNEVFHGDRNTISFFSNVDKNQEDWQKMTKLEVALRLISKIKNYYEV